MRRLFTSRGASAAAVGILVLLVAGGGYAIANGGGTITVCVHHNGGGLYEAKKCAKHDANLSWNTQGPPGQQGNPGLQGPRGPQGSPGTNGTNGTNGLDGTAKAYGHIYSDGTFDASRSKNVTASSNPSTGAYCVTVRGASAQTDGAVATPDYNDDTTTQGSPGNITHVEWDSGDCPPPQFSFKTYTVTANGTNLVNTPANQGFFFVVP
jgi:hypothetical protein